MPAKQAKKTAKGTEAVLRIGLDGLDFTDEHALKSGLEQNHGVNRVDVNLFDGTVSILYNPRVLREKALRLALMQPDFTVPDTAGRVAQVLLGRHQLVLRLSIAMVLLAISFVFDFLRHDTYYFPTPLYLLLNGTVLLMGIPCLLRGLLRLFTKGKATVDLLVIVVAAGALVIEEWPTAATVVLLALIGEMLEKAAARHALGELSVSSILGTRTALVKQDDQIVEIPLHEVQKGQTLIVQQGMMIPVDGVVTAGKAEIRESAITGETKFRIQNEGDKVLAGGIAESGSIEMCVEKAAADTVLAHVSRLITRATRGKSRTEKYIDKFAGVFLAILLVIGGGIFLVYGQLEHFRQGLPAEEALKRILTVMIVLCPFALILATPLAMYVGILRAARKGIVAKGGSVIERLSRMKILLMDKTGTLTYARPIVAGIKTFGDVTEQDVASAALFVEQRSAHPIARAICEHIKPMGIQAEDPERFHEFEGGGATGLKGDRLVKVGALWLMEDGRDIPEDVTVWLEQTAKKGCNAVLVVDKTRILGGFEIADEIREDAAETIRKLKKTGIRRIVMVTGDNEVVAKRVKDKLKLDNVFANCMPDTKLEKLQNEQSGGVVVGMVGDGINDAPALAAADVGIAMGAVGSDTAIDAADAALLHNDLEGLRELIVGSLQVMTTIKVSVAIAVCANIGMAMMAALGRIDLRAGALLQIGVVLLVTVNSTALLSRRI